MWTPKSFDWGTTWKKKEKKTKKDEEKSMVLQPRNDCSLFPKILTNFHELFKERGGGVKVVDELIIPCPYQVQQDQLSL